MRVLVLGADGFVGRRTFDALARTDWADPVAGTRRKGPGARILLDATDTNAVAAALHGIDAVVNCVTGDRRTIERNAAALFAAAGGRRIVHLSSMAVYGKANGRIDESAPLRPDTDAYAAAKIVAERLSRCADDVVLLRPGCIYGAGSTQWSLRIARLLALKRLGDMGAAGDGRSNIVHANDVVAGILASLKLEREGERTFNLAMPDAPDWNGYFLAFARALAMVPVRRIPDWQLKLETRAAIPLKLAQRMNDRVPPPIPPSLARFWRRDVTIDSTLATQRLGIAWTPLDDGLADAAYWCKGRLGLRKSA